LERLGKLIMWAGARAADVARPRVTAFARTPAVLVKISSGTTVHGVGQVMAPPPCARRLGTAVAAARSRLVPVFVPGRPHGDPGQPGAYGNGEG
jgi:hypothetical protein